MDFPCVCFLLLGFFWKFSYQMPISRLKPVVKMFTSNNRTFAQTLPTSLEQLVLSLVSNTTVFLLIIGSSVAILLLCLVFCLNKFVRLHDETGQEAHDSANNTDVLSELENEPANVESENSDTENLQNDNLEQELQDTDDDEDEYKNCYCPNGTLCFSNAIFEEYSSENAKKGIMKSKRGEHPENTKRSEKLRQKKKRVRFTDGRVTSSRNRNGSPLKTHKGSDTDDDLIFSPTTANPSTSSEGSQRATSRRNRKNREKREKKAAEMEKERVKKYEQSFRFRNSVAYLPPRQFVIDDLNDALDSDFPYYNESTARKEALEGYKKFIANVEAMGSLRNGNENQTDESKNLIEDCKDRTGGNDDTTSKNVSGSPSEEGYKENKTTGKDTFGEETNEGEPSNSQAMANEETEKKERLICLDTDEDIHTDGKHTENSCSDLTATTEVDWTVTKGMMEVGTLGTLPGRVEVDDGLNGDSTVSEVFVKRLEGSTPSSFAQEMVGKTDDAGIKNGQEVEDMKSEMEEDCMILEKASIEEKSDENPQGSSNGQIPSSNVASISEDELNNSVLLPNEDKDCSTNLN